MARGDYHARGHVDRRPEAQNGPPLGTGIGRFRRPRATPGQPCSDCTRLRRPDAQRRRPSARVSPAADRWPRPSAGGIPLRHQQPVLAVGDHRRRSRRPGVATTGVPEASASRTTLGSPSTLPASSRIDGTTATSAAASASGTRPRWAASRGSGRDRRHRPSPGRGARSSASRSPCAGQHHLHRRVARDQRGHRVDQVLEPLLLHEPPTATTSGTSAATPSSARPAGPRLIVAGEALASTP